jgi:hypothetical protein
MPSTMYAWVTEPPYAWRSRFSIRSTAMNVISIPIHSRPIRCAASVVVPHPQNGSSTTSPGLLLAETMRSSSASGF